MQMRRVVQHIDDGHLTAEDSVHLGLDKKVSLLSLQGLFSVYPYVACHAHMPVYIAMLPAMRTCMRV